jgi:hypothetical protein
MGHLVVGGPADAARLAGLERVTAFIAAVCRADATFQTMTRDDVQALPFTAASGIAAIREAVAAIITPEPDDAGPARQLGPWAPGYETKDANVTVVPAAGPGAGR